MKIMHFKLLNKDKIPKWGIKGRMIHFQIHKWHMQCWFSFLKRDMVYQDWFTNEQTTDILIEPLANVKLEYFRGKLDMIKL